jgi:hypothetical protein
MLIRVIKLDSQMELHGFSIDKIYRVYESKVNDKNFYGVCVPELGFIDREYFTKSDFGVFIEKINCITT